jgi:histidinol phosphatase-like enzyme (inositol monophosphatase family)
MKELNIAIKAALASGNILKKYFRTNVKFERKSDATPVTVVDKESEKKIVSMIKKYFPEDNILGEEFSYEKTDSEFKWIIDPLDCTKNFIRGVPFFSNFVALEKDDRIIVGVIYMPELKILAHAGLGKGSFVNNKKVRVSKTKNLKEAFVVYGDIDEKGTEPYAKKIFNLINSCWHNRGYGDALGYVLLAQGYVDIVLDRPKPWDVAPAKIIIEEAGGKVTDFNGTDSIYSGNSVATNGKLHDEVIKILKS